MSAKRILYLDPFSGVSGDMFVGALLDLGLELSVLERELAKLGLSGYRLSARRVMRGALSALKFDVEMLEHAHEHGHGHHHKHHHEHHNYAQIKAVIEQSALGEIAKRNALKAFALLAQAEGKVHNIPAEQVAFHEVGALDSIVDICGACIGLEALEIDAVRCGPVALGQGGSVKCAHGLLPVPVPAVLELMRGIPLRAAPSEKELTTPTGAALLAAVSASFGAQPELAVERVGYGAGSRNDGNALPNVLRAVLFFDESATGLGAQASATRENTETSDTILEIQANLDDATPETLGYLTEMLFELGALDVFTAPIQMKKSRPATVLTVLAEPDALEQLATAIFAESSTFGLRYQTLSRLKLARRVVPVSTPFGEVRVKIGIWQGKEVSVHPEYEDCRARAKEKNVALKEVMEAAKRAYRKG